MGDQSKPPATATLRSDGSPLTLGLKRNADTVSPEEYGLPRISTAQELTPLDMNIHRLYGARWILAFSLPSEADKGQVFESLRVGLARTIRSIPWIAGVIGSKEGSDPDENKIQILDSSNGVIFQYKDLTGDLPSYNELKQRRFPPQHLQTARISAVGVMPEVAQPPVFAAQANFIEGGLLLTAAIHHSAGDAVALQAILDAWAQNTTAMASNDTSGFTSYDSQSNDRSVLMRGVPPTDLADFPEYILHPTPKPQAADTGAPPQAHQMPLMVTHLFRFSPASLTELKSRAAAYSTNDALCAFLWRNITLARKGPGSADTTTAFAYSVNIRHRTSPPLPPRYLGNASMLGMTSRLPASSLTADDGASRAAAAIRSSLGRFKSPSRVSETIGLFSSRDDPTDFKLAYNAFLGPDLIATSWADIDIYGSNWGGVLGTPDCFRIPGDGSDGTIMILPRLEDGGLEVFVGLECGTMDRMLANEDFGRVAELCL